MAAQTSVMGAAQSFGAPEDVPIKDQIADPRLTNEQRAALITQWQIKRGMVRPDDPATNPNFGPTPPPGTPATEPGAPPAGTSVPGSTPANPQATLAMANGADPTQAQLTGIMQRNIITAQRNLEQQQKTIPPMLAKLTKMTDKTMKTLASDQDQIMKIGVDASGALQPWDADKMSAKYTTPTLEKFGSTGVMFAVLASAFTHTPMINALNGAAAAMNAISAGDEERYKNAYDAWKANNELVVKRAEIMTNAYKSKDELAEKQPELYNAEITKLAAQFGDMQTQALAINNNIVQMNDMWMKRQEAAEKLAAFNDKEMPGVFYNQALQQAQAKLQPGQEVPLEQRMSLWQMTHAKAGAAGGIENILPPELQGLTGQDLLSALPKGEANLISGMLRGELPVGVNTFRSGKGLQFMEIAEQVDPTFDAKQYAIRQKVRSDFTSGTSAKNVTSINTAISHLGRLWSHIDGLHNTDEWWLNVPREQALQFIGETRYIQALRQFQTDRKAVAEELMRTFRGSTGASEKEAAAWAAQLSETDSPAGLRSSVQEAVGLMAGRIAALQDQYNKGMNEDHDPFYVLAPEAVKTLQLIGGDAVAGLGVAPGDPSQSAPQNLSPIQNAFQRADLSISPGIKQQPLIAPADPTPPDATAGQPGTKYKTQTGKDGVTRTFKQDPGTTNWQFVQ